MEDFKGGRGKRAPYKTELLRVPIPIKPVVQALANSYRKAAETDPSGENLVEQVQSVIAEGNSSKNLLAESLVQLAELRVQLAESLVQLARNRAQLAELREENTRLSRQRKRNYQKALRVSASKPVNR